jgi:two-component system chemotaxis response regulator CheY
MSYDILITDDSAIVRSVVRKVIALAGVDVGQVHEAANGKEALEVLHGTHVDLVLADVNMPTMSGVELVQRMRAVPALASVPVVAISSDHGAARIEELRRSGVNAYVTKPFRPEQLRGVLREVLGPEAVRHVP